MSRVKLVCFFGIDGSGKSTLSHYLHDELRRKNYDVSYTWWLEGENSFIRKLLRSNRKGDSRSDKFTSGDKSGSLTKRFTWEVYQRIVLLDYLLFGIRKAWIPRITNRSRVQIFDRYMYDVIYSLYKEFNMSSRRRDLLFRTYHILLPRPDVIFFIDVPPEITYERKKTEIQSVEEARKNYSNYLELQRIIDTLYPGKIYKIDNTRELEIVKRDILNKALAIVDGDHGK